MSEETTNQSVPPTPPAYTKEQKDKKLLAGILGILLGWTGAHKFILGYTKEGMIQLVISLVTCGLFGIVGLIEGIIYLTKSDDEFVATYLVGRRGWF
ncbi:TM2 domain-containing protein [Luteolibacter algae]|uniref:TM2 domain-containing protein n=1 Tax=Luteolibacter algae TaxID=454151 RepID=A0ABW5D558_9BACT